MKHIGIVACSAEGAALCYRTICQEALAVVGKNDHPRITMDSIPMARWMSAFDAGDWAGVARVMLESAQRLGLLGTRFTMGNGAPVYRPVLDSLGIETIVPDTADARTVDRIIFAELVDGVFTDASRDFYNGAIARLANRGCDAVALACTEIPLLVRPDESPLPTLDSTRLLARAAVMEALK